MRFTWWERRRTVRNARQQLAVLWALRACDDWVTATDAAKLVDLSPSAVLSHLQILVGCGCVVVNRPEPVDGKRPQSTFRLQASGEVYIAHLVEGLLLYTSAWGGAGYQPARRSVGPV